MRLSTAVLAALALCSSVKAMPTATAHQTETGPTQLAKLLARDGEGDDACINTVGPNGELNALPTGAIACTDENSNDNKNSQNEPLPTGDLENAESKAPDVVTVTIASVATSTVTDVTTATVIATTTVMTSPTPVPLAFQVPGEYSTNESVVLWYGGPKFDDMAALKDQKGNSWQEISAVADALIQHDSTWLPHAIFGASVDFYFRNPFANYGRAARPRTKQNGDALIPLNLFPASSDNLLINVTLSETERLDVNDGLSTIWHRAIAKAFDHQEVKDRLFRNPAYTLDMYAPPTTDISRDMEMRTRTITRARAILEMLTGYNVELNEKAAFTSPDVLRSFLASGEGVDRIPTIMYDADKGMRPIIMNTDRRSSDAQPYRLLDCRATGAMNFTGIPEDVRPAYYRKVERGSDEAFDRFRSLDEVFNNMTWALRLADQKTLNIADVDEGLKPLQASFDSYYYVNGIPEEEYVTGPTSQVVVENAAQPSAS